MPLTEYDFRIARHESAHAVVAFHYGRQLDAVVITEHGGTTFSSTPDLSHDATAAQLRQVAFQAAVMVAAPITLDPDFGSGPDLQALGGLVEKGNLQVAKVLAEAERILRAAAARRQRHALEKALIARRLLSGREVEAILEAA
jgi:uncharacterized protein (DUF1501 family)